MNAERKKKFFNQIAKKANEISQSQKEFVKVKEKLFDLWYQSSTGIFISRRKQQKLVSLCLQMNEQTNKIWNRFNRKDSPFYALYHF